MARKVLKYSLLLFSFLLQTTVYAHHGGGAGGISFFAAEAFSRIDQKFALLFLPSYEKQKGPTKVIFPLGFQYRPSDRLLVYARSNFYEIHHNEEDEGEDTTTSGQGDTDLAIFYDFEYKIKETYQQSLLINFHIPTGEINKHLTEGFLRYEPSYILSYSKKISEDWTLMVFNQTGFSLRQRLKEHTHEDDSEHEHKVARHRHAGEEDHESHLEVADDHHSDEHDEEEHEESHGNHTHDEKEPCAHSFIWNAGIGILSKKAQLSIELDWENNQWNNNGLKNDLYVTPRGFFNLSEHVQIGVSLPIGLTNTADYYKILGFLRIGV